jgi:hypothetical protein
MTQDEPGINPMFETCVGIAWLGTSQGRGNHQLGSNFRSLAANREDWTHDSIASPERKNQTTEGPDCGQGKPVCSDPSVVHIPPVGVNAQ